MIEQLGNMSIGQLLFDVSYWLILRLNLEIALKDSSLHSE